MPDLNLVQSGKAQPIIQCVRHIAGTHAGTQTPGHDEPGVVIQNSSQVIPAPTDDLEIGKIRWSHLIDAHPRATIIKSQRDK